MPTLTSPTRRVLGEKDANASLHIVSPRKGHNTVSNTQSLSSAQTQSKLLHTAINAISTSPRAGQKRRITEVEDAEVQDWKMEVFQTQDTMIVSDSASETDQAETSMISTRSAADTTMTSFGLGENQEDLVEQHFDILEPEMSQRTLDKIHAVTLPQNTSQPSQLRPELMQNTSQDSVGMSSFLNLYSDPSSQASDGLKMVESAPPQNEAQEMEMESVPTSNKEVSEDAQRKGMMEEKAAQLRTRLQLALFKVETRQTNTPFSRLKVPDSHRLTPDSPLLTSTVARSSHRPHTYSSVGIPRERSGSSLEARVAALRAQATMQDKPAVRSLSSLPFPQIQPTAFSARWPDESIASKPQSHPAPPQSPPVEVNNNRTENIPSSPPLSDHSLHIHEDETATRPRSRLTSLDEITKSPMLPTPQTPAIKHHNNEQLSSPPASQAEDEDGSDDSDSESRSGTNLKHRTQPRERRLTSSVVKGEAASGLLQLMRSGRMNAGNMRGPMCGL